MMLSAHLLAALAAGLATAEYRRPTPCLNNDLSLNATNVDTLVNCTLYTYPCFDDKGKPYDSTAPSSECYKQGFNVFFSDYNMTGPLAVPRLVDTQQLSIKGYYPWDFNTSLSGVGARYLRIDSIEFPDLVNITVSGMSVKYAHNVSSLKMPKLENLSNGFLDIDLSGGPAINMSFPSLLTVDYGVRLTGNIDALEFPVLHHSPTINVTSTGDLDCVALAARVVNATRWPSHDKEEPESFICISNKNSIKTHPVPPEKTSGSSGVMEFRGNLLLLAIVIGCASLAL